MRSGIWTVGLLGTLAVAPACTMVHPAEESPTATSSAQDKSTRAMEQAMDAQQRANELEQASQRAQANVALKQRELADAQAEAATARQRAADAQRSANIQRERANARAEAAQGEAQRAQRQATEDERSSAQQVQGQIGGVKGRNVTISRGDQTPLQLEVDSHTEITLDGKKVKASELPEGADVRASFVPGQMYPKATRIEANTSMPGENP